MEEEQILTRIGQLEQQAAMQQSASDISQAVGLQPEAGDVIRQPNYVPVAFEVEYDEKEDVWKMYCPATAYSYAGKYPDSISPTPGSDEWITCDWIEDDTGDIYAHVSVTLNSDETEVSAVTELSFDGDDSESSSGAHERSIVFKVASINNGDVSQVAYGEIREGDYFCNSSVTPGSIGDGCLTIISDDSESGSYGTFTANQTGDTTICIPKANNGTLTIEDSSGTALGAFTANQAGDTTITLPAIPSAANNGTLTIEDSSHTALGSFTADQAGNTTVTLPAIPAAANNGTLTIEDSSHASLGTFTADQASNTTVTLPAIPAAANNGTLTIEDSSHTSLGAFTANQAGNTTITLPAIQAPIVPSGGASTLSFVGDVRYDVTTHQIQKRVDTLTVATGAVQQGNWEMITGGQCTPHSGEV